MLLSFLFTSCDLTAVMYPDYMHGISVLTDNTQQIRSPQPHGGGIVVGMHADNARRIAEFAVNIKYHTARCSVTSKSIFSFFQKFIRFGFVHFAFIDLFRICAENIKRVSRPGATPPN